MHKLVIGVPTYNRAEMVEEMLLRCSKMYEEAGIDIYFFDSSEDGRTKQVVARYADACQNIYYRKIPPSTHSNRKVLDIYREFAAAREYKYLWICPDHIQLTKAGLQRMERICSKEFDLCILNYRDVEHIGRQVYTDIDALFLDCAWQMTSYMATVVRLSFLADAKWEYIYKRYTIPRRINHSHVALFFEQMARKNKVKALHIPVSPRHIRVSSYRKHAYWQKETFTIWCGAWPDMVRALPDCYHNKNAVIRKHGVNSGVLSWENLIALRKEKIYDIHIYQKYRPEWRNLTDIPVCLLWMLAIMPHQVAGWFGAYDRRRKILENRLRKFCKKHEKVYIYGCGYIAKKTSDLLDGLHLEYVGYVVSDISNEKKHYNGLDVISYSDFLQKGFHHTGIILAMKKEHTSQVLKEQEGLTLYHPFLIYPYADAIE